MDHAKLIAVRMEEARDARGISVAELARRVCIDRKRLWYGLATLLGHFSQRLRPAFRNSTGLMHPSVERIRSLSYHRT